MIDTEKFGIKVLYEATLKATKLMEIGNRTYLPGEVVFDFKNVDFAEIFQPSKVVYAKGGLRNTWQIAWVDMPDLTLKFSKGTISKQHFAMLYGTNILDEQGMMYVPYNNDELEISSTNKLIINNKIAISKDIFVYVADEENMYTKVTDFTVSEDGTTISFTNDYSTNAAILNCYVEYEDGATKFNISTTRLQGFFKFEGKAHYVEQDSGLKKTVLFTAPKVQLLTGLQLLLGEKANPVVTPFNLFVKPMETYEGYKNVCLIVELLETDIDSSF